MTSTSLGPCQRSYLRTHVQPGLPSGVQSSWRIRGPLDIIALRRAVASLVDECDALRLTLDPAGQQTLRTDTSDLIGCRRIQARSARQFAGYVTRQAAVDLNADWGRPGVPPYRFRLLRRTAVDHALVATFSHLFVDGGSKATIGRLLWERYQSPGVPRPARRSYLEALRDQRERTERKAARTAEFWTRRLEQVQPATDSAPVVVPATLDRLRLSGASLETLRQQSRPSTFVTIAAALAKLLFDTGGYEHLVVDIPVDCRSASDTDVVGMFSRRLPMLVGRARTPETLAATIGQEMMLLLHHRDVPDSVAIPSAAAIAAGSGGTTGHVVLSYREHRPTPAVVDGVTLIPNAYPPYGTPVCVGPDVRVDSRPDSLDITMAVPQTDAMTLSQLFALR
jgi:hypothetical protein